MEAGVEQRGDDRNNNCTYTVYQTVTEKCLKEKNMDEICESDEKLARNVTSERKKRTFEFDKFVRRNIALLVGYAGWNYDGLVVQVGL
jgi:hypothetical protein